MVFYQSLKPDQPLVRHATHKQAILKFKKRNRTMRMLVEDYELADIHDAISAQTRLGGWRYCHIKTPAAYNKAVIRLANWSCERRR